MIVPRDKNGEIFMVSTRLKVKITSVIYMVPVKENHSYHKKFVISATSTLILCGPQPWDQT